MRNECITYNNCSQIYTHISTYPYMHAYMYVLVNVHINCTKKHFVSSLSFKYRTFGKHKCYFLFKNSFSTSLCSQLCEFLFRVMSNSLQPQQLKPTRFHCPWDFPCKNTRVGCHYLLQGIFPNQGSNLGLLLWQKDSIPLSHLEIPLSNPCA